jgi:hypothetical protein
MVPMPRIPAHFLDCAFYVYRSIEEAKTARAPGGSGFFVSVRLSDQWVRVYAVTTRHVAAGRSLVLRINTKDGNVDYVNVASDAWHSHSDNDDVVAAPILLAPQHKWSAVDVNDFVTPQHTTENYIGVGDEVFMVGRLATREDPVRNNPIVRFGHLAMMRDTIKRAYDGQRQNSFLVECRSLAGFSGSPVFVQPTPQAVVNFGGMQLITVTHPTQEGVRLLGVDWCHLELPKPAQKGGNPSTRTDENAGFAGVVPAWRLAEILNSPVLIAEREEALKESSSDSSDPTTQ